jgi:hypothetical protein
VALQAGELRRRGALRPDASGTLTWGDPARPLGAVSFRSTGTRWIVNYRNGDGAEPQFVTEEIFLAHTLAGFGGVRTYFRCPGEECNRRVEVLYFAEGRFRCRRCHGLAYESQYEDVDRRARRRANKRRARLRYAGWAPFVYAPIVRPKGMWRRKFWRLQDSIDAGEYLACEMFTARLRRMADKTDGSRKRRR